MTLDRVRTKLCGITSVFDAEMAVACGADSIGLNFVPGTRRCIERDTARAIVAAVGSRTLVVGVFANMPASEVRDLTADVGLDCVQLHGAETPEFLEAFLPHAYKAIAVRNEADIVTARRFGGKYILLDAPPSTSGAIGGTGASWAYGLAAPLAQERRVSLAGGLHADNVEAAIAAVKPWCVDVASGVEEANAVRGKKSELRVQGFMEAVRRANEALQRGT